MVHPEVQPAGCYCTTIRKAARSLTKGYDKALEGTGLRVTQYALLNNIRRLEPVSFQDLSAAIALERTTLIRNLNLLIDCPVILSGYLAPYFLPEDLDRLLGLINEHTPFPLAKDSLLTGTHGQYTPAIGAALFYVKYFLDT